VTQQTQILGYHVPGDYHFFSTLPHGDRFLGQGGEDYHDPLAFLGLVAGIHEHVHLIQSRVSGYCLWLERAKDNLANAVARALREAGGLKDGPLWHRPQQTPPSVQLDGTARTDAIVATYECDFAHQMLFDSGTTARLLDIEFGDSPLAHLLGGEARTLTTLDLLEGQAALVTEWRLNELLLEYPQQFDPEVATKLGCD
jgi:hypothetical protein